MIATAFVVFVGLLPLAAPACFNLDGSQVTEPDFVPCNGAPGSVSMCCGLNRQQRQNGLAAQAAADICLPNGLCQSQVVDNQGNQRTEFIRQSCSRPDWVGCLRAVCPSVKGGGIAMTPCATTNQTTQWCCGDNNAACCSVWPNHPDAAAIPLAFAPGSGSARGSATMVNPTTFSTAVNTAGGLSVFATPAPTDPSIYGGQSGDPGAQTTGDPASATDLGQQAQGGNGELVPASTGGLSSQAIAGIAAGVVVVVVVLVTIGCFTAESLYKKRTRLFRADRKDSLKNKIRLGGRESPVRGQPFAF